MHPCCVRVRSQKLECQTFVVVILHIFLSSGEEEEVGCSGEGGGSGSLGEGGMDLFSSIYSQYHKQTVRIILAMLSFFLFSLKSLLLPLLASHA